MNPVKHNVLLLSDAELLRVLDALVYVSESSQGFAEGDFARMHPASVAAHRRAIQKATHADKAEVVLLLTRAEARQLASVAGNGWGDGEFSERLTGPESAAAQRALEKLDQAIDWRRG